MGVRDWVQKAAETKLGDEQRRVARVFFDNQLAPLGLTEEKIEDASIEELQQTLDRVNEALSNPGAFGTLKLQFTASGQVIVVQSGSDFHFELGIVPVLLERKKLILDRLSALTSDERIESLRDLIGRKVKEDDVRSALENELQSLEREPRRLQEELEKVQQAQENEEARSAEEYENRRLELFRQKAQIWRSLVERESVATIVGGILLVVITIGLIFAMFLELKTSDILNNGFLLILGYFFGQTVSQKAQRSE